MRLNLVEVLDVRAENYVFALSVFYVFLEHNVQPLGVFQGTTEGVEFFLRFITYCFSFSPAYARLVFFYVLGT